MFYKERAVKPGVAALPSKLISYLNYSIRLQNSKRIVCRRGPEIKFLADLHRLDVLGTRALRTPAFREGHLLAFTQFLESDPFEAR